MARTHFLRTINSTIIKYQLITLNDDGTTQAQDYEIIIPEQKITLEDKAKALIRKHHKGVQALINLVSLDYISEELSLPISDFIKLSRLYQQDENSYNNLILNFNNGEGN